nr:MAG TPA: hypothetical protein [Caudoviricetes sp.]
MPSIIHSFSFLHINSFINCVAILASRVSRLLATQMPVYCSDCWHNQRA